MQTRIAASATQNGVAHIKDKTTETANDLYGRVKAMAKDLASADEVKAQLIIEYAKDAIDLFGKGNQERKVELRLIIEQAERTISPDSIDTLKKRAEKVVLRLIYPRNPKLRNVLLLGIGAFFIGGFFREPIRSFRQSYSGSLVQWWNSSSEARTDPPSINRIVLVFCDISPSLTSSEIDKSASLVADILDGLPEKTIFAVYPILTSARGRPPLLSRSIVPTIKSKTEEMMLLNEKIRRREQLKMQIHALSRDLQGRGYQSCILNSLWQAHDLFDDILSGSYVISTPRDNVDLVVISDMVEECDDTPLGRVSLNREDTAREMEMIRRSAPIYPSLSNVRITILYPSTEDSNYPNPRRTSSYYDLKEFWRLVFIRCGFKDEWFWDASHFQWIATGELPERFRQDKTN